MKRLVLVLMLVLALPALGEAKRRDGNYWRGLQRDAKLSYVMGFYDGMLFDGVFVGVEDPKADTAMLAKVFDSHLLMRDKFLNLTDSQLVDGLDHFFEDYRNRRIEILYAFDIVLKSISGAPELVVESLTEKRRKEASK